MGLLGVCGNSVNTFIKTEISEDFHVGLQGVCENSGIQ